MQKQPVTHISSRTDFLPIVKAGQLQSKGCNGIMFDNDNGGGVTVIINNAWIIPPGTAKSILLSDVRAKDQSDYQVRFDTANAYGLNTSATESAVAVVTYITIECKCE